MEVAKRRLVYTLLELRLPIVSKVEDVDKGLAFDFIASSPGAEPVLTGHDNGVITVNVAEADDAEREKRRCQLGEQYRTLLGHFRHEIGHYYWDRLLRDTPRLATFRSLFGDEREDYKNALNRLYQNGAPADWHNRFISAYASAHPWEDFAETWAHYFHMIDTLEIAAACGLSLRPVRTDEPALAPSGDYPTGPFARIAGDWYPLTYTLNNLNRGLGLADPYPFILSTPVLEKLEFVHQTISESSSRARGAAPASPELVNHS